MRISRLAILVSAVSASAGTVHALEASNTMASWRAATSDEKSKLVTELLKQDGQESATSRVIKCLDAAADAPGHAELSIRQVAKACEKVGGEPV